MSETTDKKQSAPGSENPKPQATLKVPRILLEILVVGSLKNETKVLRMLKDIQKQFDSLKSKNQQQARLLWIKEDGTKTKEEMRQWLLDNCYCKYYIFTPDTYKVPSDFVKEALKKINTLETALNSIKMFGLVRSAPRKNPSEISSDQPAETAPPSPLKVVK